MKARSEPINAIIGVATPLILFLIIADAFIHTSMHMHNINVAINMHINNRQINITHVL